MRGRINDRWTRIPEAAIFDHLAPLGETWGTFSVNVGGDPRHYLGGDGGHAYPYSLPPAVIDRLAAKLNEVYMFDWKDWISRFIGEPGYNDAGDYGVVISDVADPAYEVIGIHHLTPDENQGLHHIFIEVLDDQNHRMAGAEIHWTWQEKTEPGEPNPVRLDKPPHEIASLALFSGATFNIWHALGQGVVGLSANHDDELGPDGGWNRRGHHSFIVCFRRVRAGPPPPDPDPDPDPDPSPPAIVGGVQVSVNQAWIAGLRPDAAGNVTFFVDIRG